VMSRLGDVIGYADEKEGSLVHDVCPVPGRETSQENASSVHFDLHTENAFHRVPPDHVGLACLRPDRDGLGHTLVASMERALPTLPARAVAVLRQPRYRVRPPASFGGGDLPRECLPVLTGHPDAPTVRHAHHTPVAADAEAAGALRQAAAALAAVAVSIAARPGDLLLIDNRAALHGRTAFHPRFDGEDRWLQRCYVVADLRASAVMRDRRGHVLRPHAKPAAASS
jgi:L-asparagine oxygenase